MAGTYEARRVYMGAWVTLPGTAAAMMAAVNRKQDSNVQPGTFGIITKPMGGCYGQTRSTVQMPGLR